MNGLMHLASGIYEEVDLELGHTTGGLKGVAGRIYRDLRAGDDGGGGGRGGGCGGGGRRGGGGGGGGDWWTGVKGEEGGG